MAEETLRWEDLNASQRKARKDHWTRGDLRYKLHDGQLRVDTMYELCETRWFMLDVARRWGKSYYGLVKAMMACLTQDLARVPYVASSKKDVQNIIVPLMRQLCLDAPPDLAPIYKKTDGIFRVPSTGGEMVIVGADKNPDGARGTHLDFAVIDEGAFFQDLEYMLRSVLFPQMQGRPNARMLLLSTPPVSPLHPWTNVFLKEAIAKGSHYRATIEDNPLLTPDKVEEFNEMAGGRESTTCRRENYAEHIVDAETAIIPEFREHKEEIVFPDGEIERPPFFDTYVAMDPGTVDLWVTIFGYYDFVNACVVIEDELVTQRCTTGDFANALMAKERKLWDTKPPHLRVSDHDGRLMSDLLIDHKIYFQPTFKKDKQAALSRMRLWLQSGRVKIHEGCKP